jgi:hypothetical protein
MDKDDNFRNLSSTQCALHNIPKPANIMGKPSNEQTSSPVNTGSQVNIAFLELKNDHHTPVAGRDNDPQAKVNNEDSLKVKKCIDENIIIE